MVLVFIGHRHDVHIYGYIAQELRANYGIDCEFWTYGKNDYKLALNSNKYSRVIDLLSGKPSREKNFEQIEKRFSKWVSKQESTIGENFLHKDILLDRYFQGVTATEIQCSDLKERWQHKDIIRVMTRLYDRVCAEIQTGRITAFVVESNSAPYRLVRRLAAYFSIPSFVVMSSRMWDDRCYIETEMSFMWSECNEIYNKFIREGIPPDIKYKAELKFTEIKHERKQPEYFFNQPIGAESIGKKLKASRILQHLFDWYVSVFESWHKHPRNLPSYLISPLGRIKRHARASRSYRYYMDNCVTQLDMSNKYATYLLHVQPEVTVEAMAFEYQDQVATIRNIVSYLPADMPLVVKEHKPTAGRRPINFYADLVHTPGVILLAHSISSHHLVENAAVVVTLTGTVALESIIYGVPVIVLGEVFFRNFKGVYHPANLQELRELLHAPEVLVGADYEDALRMLSAIHEASSQGVYPPDHAGKPELSADMVKGIYKYLSQVNK